MTDNKRQKVVFVDFVWGTSEIEEAKFSKLGAEVVLLRDRSLSVVLSEVQDADVIVNASLPVTSEIIDAAQRCHAIVHSGVGVDSIDVGAATRAGIIVANVVGYCNDEVSDHALALLLCSARRLIPSDREVKCGRWSWKAHVPMHRIRGSVLGIIGLGRIGRTVALKAMALGMRCIGYDPAVAETEFSEHGVGRVSLERLLRESDFVSIHCPLTDSTRNLIGESQLRMMKRSSFIINTSRGAIIDEHALARALQERWIAGAALDVLVDEPPSISNRLLQQEHAVLTPHTAFYSEESLIELRERTCDVAIDVLAKKWPATVVNPEVQSNARLLFGRCTTTTGMIDQEASR